MKQDNKIARTYALVVFKDGVYTEISEEELDDLKSSCPLLGQLMENQELVSRLKEPDLNDENTPLYDNWEKAAKRLLNSLWRSNSAQIFHNPVDPDRLGIPDYFEIVKDPIDFGTIKQRLNYSQYLCIKDVMDDIKRCFENCIVYNGEDSPAGQRCLTVMQEFQKLYCQLNVDFYVDLVPGDAEAEQFLEEEE